MHVGSPARAEDGRIWVGRIVTGREAEHEQFLEWLRSGAAQDVFRRRRLDEYALWRSGDQVTVVFKAPHTGDPRLMIDVLRYTGLWPECWVFESGGRLAELGETAEPVGAPLVHWCCESDPPPPLVAAG